MLRHSRVIGIGIFFFWLVVTGLYVYQQDRPSSIDPAERQLPTEASDTWMGISVASGDGGEAIPIGYANYRTTPGVREGDSGVAYALTMRMDTQIFAQRTQLDLTGSAWVTQKDGLKQFQFRMHSGGQHAVAATGVVENKRLQIAVDTGGETFPLAFPIRSDLIVRGGLGTTTLNLPALEIGDTVTVDAFDPMTLSYGKAYVTCLDTETIQIRGEPVLTKVLETELAGLKSRTWVTPEEEVVRIESPLGFILEVTSREDAISDFEGKRGGETLLSTLAVRPEGKRPFRGARRMRFRLSQLPPDTAPPADANQRETEPGVYEIVVPRTPAADTMTDPELIDYLGDDPFIHTGHPKIRSQAEAIVAESVSDWQRASALQDWVFENIRKQSVLSFPSALEVLESRTGDCNEHTVLFTAMSRTVGIPTRVAVGLVWSDDLAAFYYHAWPEVYMNEWIPLEPTLGQTVADATHIKLLEGSVEEWPRLAPYLGQIQIEVLDVE